MRLTTNADQNGNTIYFKDGVKCSKAEWEAAFAAIPNRLNLADEGEPLTGQLPTTFPMVSEALAVHPEQVGEANERNRQHGINVQYHPKTGCAILPDNGARKRLLKLEGYRDRRGFY